MGKDRLFRNSKGFSLIEAAIVLGVVGLVIGGIWAAASSVREQNRVLGMMEMLALAQDVARPFKKLGVGDGGFTTTVGRGRALPGGYTYSASNGISNGKTRLDFLLYTDGNLLTYVTFLGNSPMGTGLDVKLCVSLSQRLLASASPQTMTGINWTGNPYDDYPYYSGWTSTSAKPALGNITSDCQQSHGMDFVFKL